MSPQFVDWNGDGHLDIVAGTFSGSPYVALGGEKGFTPPVEILDAKGQRIVINQFWNLETKQWDSTDRCNPKEGGLAKGHLTSAFAHDWDGDGDLDLLLGDYDAGHLYLRLNAGTADKPAFESVNRTLLSEGKPIHVGKMATMRLLDVNNDGLKDLLLGSMGDTYGSGPAGEVTLLRNVGTASAPVFAGSEVLLRPTKSKTMTTMEMPAAGLYMDMADINGDGLLDLVVGGYAFMAPGAGEKGEFNRKAGVWLALGTKSSTGGGDKAK
ncbi:MAG TPA: VCBS repeat-containing protein [Planctomycetota bacterium]|nr:VCBS repeat-containing protein [Planctomycetota bacterium]